MVKVNVFRNDNSPGITCSIPKGLTVEEFFCKDFMAYPISPVRILVNGEIPSLKDNLKDGDEVTYVKDAIPLRTRH